MEVLELAEPLVALVEMLVELLLVAVLAELLVVLVAEMMEVFSACRHKVQLDVVVDSVA